MRRDEIRRVREHLARASKAQKDIKAVLALFEEIASVPNAEKHIETPEESLGLVPARLIEVSSH